MRVPGLTALRWVVYLMGGIFFISLLNTGSSFLALKLLEKKARHPIQGNFIPNPFFPSFTLKNSAFNWRDRFQVHSGTVAVHYTPLFFLPGQKFRIQIRGKDLDISISGEWARSQGFSELKAEHLEADIVFPIKETLEILSFEIRSPQIEFRLERGERDLEGSPIKRKGSGTENLM